jgi:ATP-dependent DNA helicase RecQ
MKDLAESVICRRKVLLNHFGETYSKKCNNCDVCHQPYTTFDGTQETHTILEKIKNTTTLTETTLITTLPCSIAHSSSWRFYLSQLKNKGLISHSGSQNQYLEISIKGQEILTKNKKNTLVKLSTFIETT